jgi:hypothetical protein
VKISDAEYLADIIRQLSQMARDRKAATLAYLLQMAHLEASNIHALLAGRALQKKE